MPRLSFPHKRILVLPSKVLILRVRGVLAPRSSPARSVGHDAVLRLEFREGHQFNGVPGASFEESAVRALAGAELAADAEQGIHLSAAEGRLVAVRDPAHAVFARAVVNSGRGAGATGALSFNEGTEL